MALGRAFVRGDWDCAQVGELIARLSRANVKPPVSAWPAVLAAWLHWIFGDGGSRKTVKELRDRHYDLSEQVFEAMLDRRMVYSCGYWVRASSLEEAQEAKLDLVCRKLKLQPGMRLLDIGCGWGGLVKYAAENYGVECEGLTISRHQFERATEVCKGLPVQIRLQDYRDMSGQFDRIASIGMFEHVGRKHYREYMNLVRRCLKDDGLFLLHCIGSSDRGLQDNPWITQFIFPGGHIPAMVEMASALERRFVVEDWHNFGADYDKTLQEWFARFDASWSALSDKMEPEFYRRWKLYLLGCAGAFRARTLQLWQLVLSPSGVPGGYIPER